MKRGVMGLVLIVAVLFVTMAPVYAQDEKPLAPGWLSLDGSVGVLDRNIAAGKSALEKALGIAISGFFDTSYTYSFNRPGRPGNDISLRVFDVDHNDVVFNHFNLTIQKPEKDWGVGFKLSGDFGRTAELLREATLWGRTLQSEPSAELREAYLTTTLPIGAGLQIKGGLFVTLLGTEIIPEAGAHNDNISRSYLFGFAIPFRHLGVLFSYPVHKMVTITAGPVTGWDNPRDNNNSATFLGGISITPSDSFSLNSSVVYGAEQSSNGPKRFAWANVFTIKPADALTLLLEYTYGHEEKASLGGTRDATWQGFGGIASYAWTDRFSTALRGEIFNDRDGARLGGDFFGNHANVTVGEVTITGSYKFTKMLLGRAEFRQDWSDERVFQKGTTRADKSQTSLGLQLVYAF